MESLSRSNEYIESNEDFLLFWKAYKVPDKALGNLKVPTDEFFNVVKTAYSVFENEFKNNYHKIGIGQRLFVLINEQLKKKFADYWFGEEECVIHRDHIIKTFIRLHIFYNLKWMSRDIRQAKRVGSKRNSDSFPGRPCKKLLKHSQ